MKNAPRYLTDWLINHGVTEDDRNAVMLLCIHDGRCSFPKDNPVHSSFKTMEADGHVVIEPAGQSSTSATADLLVVRWRTWKPKHEDHSEPPEKI